ncbi:MAG: hypothetical protein HY720_22525 [Planctomycetes bacterium]|nr:hypothetical protein [Planctomycetota bacterium]
MAVRVRVRIERLPAGAGPVLETIALANTGYEGGPPNLSLPILAARALGLWPPPSDAVREALQAYGGIVQTWAVRDAVRLKVVAPDREGPWAQASVVLAETDNEAVLSDCLLDAIELLILKPGQGTWCFWNELGQLTRKSEPPTLW